MSYLRLPILFITLFVLSPYSPSQNADMTGPPQSIYRNFVGSWEGKSDYAQDGQLKHDALKLVVTEEPKRHCMRFDQFYVDEKGTHK